MLKNWWIIGALPLVVIMAVSTFYLLDQEKGPVDERKAIHTAIVNFGSLSERGIAQVEILSDREVRFLVNGGAKDDNFALGKEDLDNILKDFCQLVLSAPPSEGSASVYKLSYHHRQIAAISGEYSCQYAATN